MMKASRISKFISVIPAVCLLLSSFTALGANAAENIAGGVIVEIYSGEELQTTKEFTYVSEAWHYANANAGTDKEAVITLGEDWIHDDSVIIKEGQHVTLDLNGHCVKRNRNHEMKSDGNVFRVQENAVFTVRDSRPKSTGYDGIKGGVITGGASSNTGGGVHIDENGEFRMEGGTIYDCITDADGGAVNVSGGSTKTKFTMTGGRIYSCKTIDSTDECCGGGIYLERGEVTISDAKIDDCYSEDDGGAIYSFAGVITLNNVVFSGNKAHEDGGVICTAIDTKYASATQITAHNCTFAGNHADENAGAVLIKDDPKNNGAVVFHNCQFRNNDAKKKGGAIYVKDNNVALSSCEIINNHAGDYGGGVFVDDRYNITLKGKMIIKDNTSDKGNGVANLALEDGAMGTARIMNGGLYKNSYVRVGTTTDKSIMISEWMSQYQMQYFQADEGTLSAKELRNVEADMVVTASIFGDGSWVIIIVFLAAGLIATITLVIYKKRMKAATEGGKENGKN